MGLFDLLAPSLAKPLSCQGHDDEGSKERQEAIVRAKKQLTDKVEHTVDKAQDLKRELTEQVKDATHRTAATVGIVSTPTRHDAEVSKWQKQFDQWAQEIDDSGVKYMSEESFIGAIAPTEDFIKIGKRQYGLLYKVASKGKGKVTADDYVAFQRLLKEPDAEFRVAFSVFDLDGNGSLGLDEFKKVFSESLGPKSLPFNFDTPWLKMYMGKAEGDHVVGYTEFTQLMKGLQGERVRQAFQALDRTGTGYVTGGDFARIIKEIASHKLSDQVVERLPTISQLTQSGRVSYSELRAFVNVVKEIDLIEIIVKHAINRSKDSRISKEDFMDAAGQHTRYGVFTPLEAEIIFHFANNPTEPSSRLRLRDFNQLFDPKWDIVASEESLAKPSVLHEIGKSIYSFGLGGIAGGLGASAVYPIDLVKTRMQNQRSKVVGELLYRNSMDCVRKVYANEGLRGFYRGLPPQLLGVAPEKAIKLTVNDLVRRRATDPETGKIKLIWEFAAGGCAGASQVVFTNPLEIVKIRLQMQGEAVKRSPDAIKRGAMHIVKQLGLVGLYRGSAACLLRDVPFSMIYFTAYNHLKKDYFGEGVNGKKLGYGETLLAATIAGAPSAYLTTPADVVKTRLQSEARKGETHYKGLIDALRKIPAEEGFGALFKGGPARILRSSPQFGVTLVAYESLQALLPYPLDRKANAVLRSEEDISKVRARRALRTLLDANSNMGLLVRKNFLPP